jgi:2-phospho-L-lactate guanylyltransferase
MNFVLIPCKNLDRGKSRLAGCLSRRARAALCEFFLHRTLGVATTAFHRRSVRVITADWRVAIIAKRYGVDMIHDGGAGLNDALARGLARLFAEAGDCDALILPIDLPLATPAALRCIVAAPEAAVIVPDEIAEGTNILRLTPPAMRRFPLNYGPQSFARHMAASQRAGITLCRIDVPELMFDVDSPRQYRRWAPREPAWLPAGRPV